MFNKRPRDPNAPNIRSKRDLVAYLRAAVNDAQVASLIGDVLEQTGLDGRVEIKQGGYGQPYQLEKSGKSQRTEGATDVPTSHIEHCHEMINRASSDSEKNWWRQQLAEALGLVAVIWIKANSQEEYEAKRQLVMRAHELAIQVARQSAGK